MKDKIDNNLLTEPQLSASAKSPLSPYLKEFKSEFSTFSNDKGKLFLSKIKILWISSIDDYRDEGHI